MEAPPSPIPTEIPRAPHPQYQTTAAPYMGPPMIGGIVKDNAWTGGSHLDHYAGINPFPTDDRQFKPLGVKL